MPEAAEILIFELVGKTGEPRGPAMQERIARMFGAGTSAATAGEAKSSNDDKNADPGKAGTGAAAGTATEAKKSPEELAAMMNERACSSRKSRTLCPQIRHCRSGRNFGSMKEAW